MYCKFLLLPVVALLFAGCRQVPAVRVGVISDTQSHNSPDNIGRKEMRANLELMKKENIDVLIYGGDVSDNGDKAVYQEYRQVFDEVFGDDKPEEIVIMGNHDYWNDLPTEEAQVNFLDNSGIESLQIHKVVNGYDFIGLSPENGALHGTYTPECTGKFLSEAMADAEKNRPGKPVFVVTHQPPKNTVYGSDDWGNQDLVEYFKNHPQIINFSGHTHYPIEDERAIHQRDFTSVATASLSYCEMEVGKVNGSVPPKGWDVRRFLLLDVYPDQVVIHRYASGTTEELKPDALWTLPVPLAKETFTYTDARAQERPAPQFTEGAKAAVTFPSVPFEKAVLTVDAARHPDLVHSYAVTITEKNKPETTQELLFFSDFYAGVKNMAPQLDFDIPAKYLDGETVYQGTITPIESFGKRGDAISFEFSTPKRAVLKEQ